MGLPQVHQQVGIDEEADEWQKGHPRTLKACIKHGQRTGEWTVLGGRRATPKKPEKGLGSAVDDATQQGASPTVQGPDPPHEGTPTKVAHRGCTVQHKAVTHLTSRGAKALPGSVLADAAQHRGVADSAGAPWPMLARPEKQHTELPPSSTNLLHDENHHNDDDIIMMISHLQRCQSDGGQCPG